MGVREEVDHDNSTAARRGTYSQPGLGGCRLHAGPDHGSDAVVTALIVRDGFSHRIGNGHPDPDADGHADTRRRSDGSGGGGEGRLGG
jgi:hypothetical protein